MSTAEAREGGCWCGAVRYRLTEPLTPICYCHCSQCVRTHGHVAAFCSTPRSGFKLLKDGGLKWHQCSDIARRAFCSECGSRLFWLGDEDTGTIEIAVGSLDHHRGLEGGRHIFVADKPPYYEILDRLSQRP